jgi:hypothetical protein
MKICLDDLILGTRLPYVAKQGKSRFFGDMAALSSSTHLAFFRRCIDFHHLPATIRDVAVTFTLLCTFTTSSITPISLV